MELIIYIVMNSTQITHKNRKCWYDKDRIKLPTKQVPLYLDRDLKIPFKMKHKLIPKGVHVYLPWWRF